MSETYCVSQSIYSRKHKYTNTVTNCMGNKPTHAASPQFRKHEWRLVDREMYQNEGKGDFKVYKHSQSEDMIDQYELLWPTEEDLSFYMDSYSWRKTESNIVNSRFIVPEQNNEKFCSKSYGAKVYIEHIQTRLSDVTDIPYPDNLYVAMSTLDGFQKLYENLHYFKVQEDQICVDQEGLIKVWVNSDLSKNYPESDHFVDQRNKDETNMVEELMEILWSNTDSESEELSFEQFYRERKGKRFIGFDEAKVIVNEYSRQQGEPIPNRFESILQMMESSGYCETRQQFENNGDNHQNYHQDNAYHQNGGNNHYVPPNMDFTSSAVSHQQYSQQGGPNSGQIGSQVYVSPGTQSPVAGHPIPTNFLGLRPVQSYTANQPILTISGSTSQHVGQIYGNVSSPGQTSPMSSNAHIAVNAHFQPHPHIYQHSFGPNGIALPPPEARNTANPQFYQQNEFPEQRISVLNSNNSEYQHTSQQPQSHNDDQLLGNEHQNQSNIDNGYEHGYDREHQQNEDYDNYEVPDNHSSGVSYQQHPHQSRLHTGSSAQINRSMQLINKSEEHSMLRVNKSHIEQQKRLSSQSHSQQGAEFDSRHALSSNYDPQRQYYSRSGHTVDRQPEHSDTKYYTLHREIDLDDEIAQDLLRYIHAN